MSARVRIEQLEAAIAANQKYETWSIGLYSGRSPFHLSPHAHIANPILTRRNVTGVPAIFVADPFLLRTSANWLLFFEVLNQKEDKGEIGLAASADALHWTYQRIVLAEPFHLSYPQVFEHDGTYYLIPESYQAGSVRLYRATDFPAKWAFVSELIESEYIVDASIFRNGGRWYMFADTSPQRDHSVLRLYHSDQLAGGWSEHPASPLVNGDARIARPAGRVLNYGGHWIRFAQDCQARYGTAVRAFRVLELSRTTYAETPVRTEPILAAQPHGWNSGGMHHIDAQEIARGQWLAAVDGWTTP